MLDTKRYWQEEWAARVLRWARGKTRTAQEAEDLAQSVLLEWLRAVRAQEERGVCVAEPEHLLWRIARFVWCKSLRPGTYYRCEPLSEKLSAGETPEESAERQDEQRRQTAFVRRQIMRLSRIQRETLVWYYLENRTTADIARRLRVSENTVRWHLSDSRKKIREADGKMTSTEFVYCPKKLHVAINGEAYDDRLTREVLDNLLHQNILLRCYAQGQTAQELCNELGVARPYIEDAVNVLLRDELLTADGGRVRTNFIITSGAQEEARLAVYDAHKDELSREIVRQLMAHEQEIRAIGFIGCDVPMQRLLWWLIYRCTAALPNPAEMPPRPYHADGGAYHLMGFAREPENRHYLAWDYNGPMYNDGFRWFGLQHFGNSPVQELFELNQPHMGKLCALLIRLIQADFDPSCVTADEQELLAELLARSKDERHISVISNCIPVASFCPGTYNIICGGSIDEDSLSMIGHEAESYFDSIIADKAFMGANGVFSNEGPSVSSFFQMAIKRKMMSRASQSIFLIDSNKFKVRGLSKLCSFQDVYALITVRTEANSRQIDELRAAGVRVDCANEPML